MAYKYAVILYLLAASYHYTDHCTVKNVWIYNCAVQSEYTGKHEGLWVIGFNSVSMCVKIIS